MIPINVSGTHLVTNVQSMETGKSMVFNCSIDSFRIGLQLYRNGMLIQNAFPFLSDDEREFLISGLLPAEFDGLFKEY